MSTTNGANLLPNPADILTTLELSCDDDPASVIEIRIKGIDGRKNHGAGGYYDRQHLDQAVKDIISWTRRAEAVWSTFNDINPSLISRSYNHITDWADELTKDKDVRRRRDFFIDFDPRRAEGIGATDVEKQAALECMAQCRDWLRELGWPEPRIIGDSGNGGHLRYAIALANDYIDDKPTAETAANTQLVSACLQAIKARFRDETTIKIDLTNCNAARACKVYGSLSRKGDPRSPDRPHRVSRLLEVNRDTAPVTIEQLRVLAAIATDEEPEPKQSTNRASNTHKKGAPADDSEKLDLQAWIDEHHVPVGNSTPWNDGTKWEGTGNACLWGGDHAGYSSYIIQLSNGAISAHCHHDSCGGSATTGGKNRWPELRQKYEPGYDKKKRPRRDKDDAPEFSEEELALRLVQERCAEIRYVGDASEWRIWNGCCWRSDTKRQVFDFSRHVCRRAAGQADQDPKLVRLARALASAKTRYSVTSLASDDQRIAMLAHEFDCDLTLLGTPDGTVILSEVILSEEDIQNAGN